MATSRLADRSAGLQEANSEGFGANPPPAGNAFLSTNVFLIHVDKKHLNVLLIYVDKKHIKYYSVRAPGRKANEC